MNKVNFETHEYGDPVFISNVSSLPPGSRELQVSDVVRLYVEGFELSKGECRVRIDSIEGCRMRGTVVASTSYKVAGGPEILDGSVVEFEKASVFSWV